MILKCLVIFIVVLLAITILNALFSGIVYYFMSKPFGKNILSHNGNAKRVSDAQNDNDYEKLCITSNDGIRLNGYFFPCDNADKLIVILHGYGDHAKKLLPYIKHFQSSGFNILVPDLRAHGESGGTCGFGYKDAPDVIEWIKYLEGIKGTGYRITIFGTSMGATTAINTALLRKDIQIDALIADSAAPDFYEIIKKVYRWRVKYPWFLIHPFFVMYFRLFGGLTLNDLSLYGRIQSLDVPILFIHGKKDGLIDYKRVEELYSEVQCEKDILLSEIADHLGMVSLEPDLYWERVDAFLNRIHSC